MRKRSPRALSAAGLTIVSGLALGIDSAAHRGALDGDGSSIAVTGTGPDRVYPAANRELAHELASRGLIVSEFTPGTPPLPQNFPRRNRVVSGLARGVLVIEATLSSGSLITARLGGEQGREVFALPGSIHSPFSKGCHKLLARGREARRDRAGRPRRIATAARRDARAPRQQPRLTTISPPMNAPCSPRWAMRPSLSMRSPHAAAFRPKSWLRRCSHSSSRVAPRQCRAASGSGATE